MSSAEIQDIDRITSELGRLSGTMRGYVDSIGRKESTKRLDSDLTNKIKHFGAASLEMTSSFKNASRYMTSFAAGGIFSAAIGKIISSGNELTSVYQDLANNGQTFSGSLLTMVQSAANAGMPLDDFAEVVKKSAKSLSYITMNQFVDFQKGLRTTLVAQGNYAMSVKTIDDMSAGYMETLRKSHSLDMFNGARAVKNMDSLARVTTNLSDVTKVAVDEIASLASSALQGSLAMSAISGLPASMRQQAAADMQQVTTILASQAGKAGQFLTSAFADTVGALGRTEFTSQGQSLIEAGLGQVASKFNELASNQSPEKAVETINYFIDEVDRNRKSLTILAMQGNAGAKEALEVAQEMKKLNAKEIMSRRRNQDGITSFFNSISTVWDQIIGKFKSGFLDGLKPLFETTKDITKTAGFNDFAKFITKVGLGLGTLVGSILNPETLGHVGRTLSNLYDSIVSVGKAMGHLLGAINWEYVAAGISGLSIAVSATTEAFSWALSKITGIFGDSEKTTKILAGLVGGIWLAKKAFDKFSFIKNMFGGLKDMVVNAATVIVNGGSGGSGGSDSGIDVDANGKKSKRKLSWKTKARLAARRAGRNIKKAPRAALGMLGGLMESASGLKSAGKIGAKVGLKSLAKKIPILGALAGSAFAIQRAMKGDWAGAAMEMGSGLLGTMPGMGTAGSIALDAALMAKDSGGIGKTSPSNRMSLLAGMGGIGDDKAPSTETPEVTAPTNDFIPELTKQLQSLVTAQKETIDHLIGIARGQQGRDEQVIRLLQIIRDRS